MTELICGACRGRMRVVDPSETVVCPHCGALVPPPASPTTTQPPPALLPQNLEPSPTQVVEPSATQVVADTPSRIAGFGHDAASLRVGEHTRLDSANPTFLGESAIFGEVGSGFGEFLTAEDLDVRSKLVELVVPPLEAADSIQESGHCQESDRGFEANAAADATADSIAAEADDPYDTVVPRMELPTTRATQTDFSTTENWPSNSSPQGSAADTSRGISRLTFMIVLSYASAMTLA